jgi:hypothetical protein
MHAGFDAAEEGVEDAGDFGELGLEGIGWAVAEIAR